MTLHGKPLLTKQEVVASAQSRRAAKAAKAKTKPKAKYKTAGGRHSDTAKLDWLRTRPCMVSENRHEQMEVIERVRDIVIRRTQTPCVGRVEAHHDRHHGSRATDKRTTPICEGHHTRNADSLHKLGRRGFETFHRLSMDAETSRYEAEWQSLAGRSPTTLREGSP